MFIVCVKAVWYGILNGFKWYGKTIRECKWYILPFMIDMLLIPAKLVAVPIMCLTKHGRNYLIGIGQYIEEDLGA
jgi:hypothetical protein